MKGEFEGDGLVGGCELLVRALWVIRGVWCEEVLERFFVGDEFYDCLSQDVKEIFEGVVLVQVFGVGIFDVQCDKVSAFECVDLVVHVVELCGVKIEFDDIDRGEVMFDLE